MVVWYFLGKLLLFPLVEIEAQVSVKQEPVHLFLRVEMQQRDAAIDEVALLFEAKSGCIGIHEHQQVNRLSLCAQLPGHFIGDQPSIAPSPKVIRTLWLYTAHGLQVRCCHLFYRWRD